MRDLGLVNYFLGIFVSTCKGGYFLNQSKYIHDLLNHCF
uniref:Reverse transcriptase Ty1/copia-type domain-containing protein n=1 Tax=Solanum lycopersicum TaxID=4081 RepID=A0A3Q7EB62_SOLLC